MTATREATVFVPGHITGFFTAHHTDDPVTTGSRGAGLTISTGVELQVCRGQTVNPGVRLNGESISIEAVDTIIEMLDLDDICVNAQTALPLGAGFGVSGAMTLGVAFGGNIIANEMNTRVESELVTAAHCAEVRAGTGLGDVVAQARGGFPIRVEPGAPHVGQLDGITATPRVEYCSFGTVSTESVLNGDTDALTTAGEQALDTLQSTPTASQFMTLAHQFSVDAELLTPEVQAVISDVQTAGGDAAMAMLGNTVFAFDDDLSTAGYDPVVCQTHSGGVSIQQQERNRTDDQCNPQSVEHS
ncbi:pantoate kinase [Haloquadratum walsbyi]|jgi:pantothenate kinase (EC 2.7.1.33)|uniref:Pantoate kinase n=1 Tax=Haloquadratum walsbyi J07HQW2 TaxID=1238425 RepID=U1PVE7_9EURY|nr:pantoate kinase [Haloquadratum walsbyi]ERG96356.1 MAG: putative archaeal kinase (sugar kinase superfamily) [Haloquadratum walsbyi J07HQW2]